MFTSLYQIAKNTFRESVREPIYLLVLLSALCLIGIYPIFTLFVFREQIKLVVDSAMATTLVFGWIIAVLCASHAIAREIDNGTALLVLAKPVNRVTFIIAKILGILLALTLFCFLTGIATLIAVRVAKDQFWLDNKVLGTYFGSLSLCFIVGGLHNYVTRSSFPMATVMAMFVIFPLAAVLIYFLPAGDEHQKVTYSWEIVPALVLILYSVWAMGSLAAALSTRCSLVTNLLLCSVIFVVGLMSDYLLGRHVREVWTDSVPTSRGALWISSYEFVNTETADVREWSRAEPADNGKRFVVWSDQNAPGRLPQVGTDPEAAWKDGAGWVNNVDNLSGIPIFMGVYDPETLQWEQRLVYRENDIPAVKSAKGPFTSYVFRRSVHRPRTPVGGTYARPYPNPGSAVASVLYACVPNWQLFWMADALAAGKMIPGMYVFLGGIYVFLVVVFFVVLAVLLFWRREVGEQMVM